MYGDMEEIWRENSNFGIQHALFIHHQGDQMSLLNKLYKTQTIFVKHNALLFPWKKYKKFLSASVPNFQNTTTIEQSLNKLKFAQTFRHVRHIEPTPT
jgi:hypothetical protein